MDAQCCNCDEPAKAKHHIVPKNAGGSDRPTNFAPLCSACHGATRRGGRTETAMQKIGALERELQRVKHRAEAAEALCEDQDAIVSSRDAEMSELHGRIAAQSIELERLVGVDREAAALRERFHQFRRTQEPVIVGGMRMTRHEAENDYLVGNPDSGVIASIPADPPVL